LSAAARIVFEARDEYVTLPLLAEPLPPVGTNPIG
jgi:hypothetical protein